MNLYSHSEEEEPDPWLTQRPPSPHGIRTPPHCGTTAPPGHTFAPASRPQQPGARAGGAAEPGQAAPCPRLCSRCARPGGAASGRLAGRAGTALSLSPSRSCAVSLRQAGSGRRAASRAEPGRAGPGMQRALRRLKASSRPAGPAAGAEVGFSWLKDLEVAFLQFLGGGRAAFSAVAQPRVCWSGRVGCKCRKVHLKGESN